MDKRAERDIELEIASKRTFESGRAALERKAQIYEKLRKGKSGGLSDAQIETLLVDVSTHCTFKENLLTHATSSTPDLLMHMNRTVMRWTNR